MVSQDSNCKKDGITIIDSQPQSLPYDEIVLECGLIPIECRIKEKILKYFHTKRRLTKTVYKEHKRLSVPPVHKITTVKVYFDKVLSISQCIES